MGPKKPRKRSSRSYERILLAMVMNSQVTDDSTTRGRNDHARRGTTSVLITLIDVPTTITRPPANDNHSIGVTVSESMRIRPALPRVARLATILALRPFGVYTSGREVIQAPSTTSPVPMRASGPTTSSRKRTPSAMATIGTK